MHRVIIALKSQVYIPKYKELINERCIVWESITVAMKQWTRIQDSTLKTINFKQTNKQTNPGINDMFLFL